MVDDARILIPINEFPRHMDDKTFQPSGIERHPVSGNYFVVAARQHAIAEITPEGQVVAVMEISPDRHPQAEGITFTPDYDVIISDEGKDKRAQLTIYSKSAR